MNFTPTTVINDIMSICDKHNETEKKNCFKELFVSLGYAAPEIRESRFWSGNGNWLGIIEILNKECVLISDCNVEIDKYYKDMMKKYKEKGGFDGLS
jgi:hypothetical protein